MLILSSFFLIKFDFMAHPIYTFIYKKTQQRYFQIWNTIAGLPETVPLNLLTFLQYWGIDSKESVSTLYSLYPRLITTGSTLRDFSFNEFPDYIKQLSYDYLELGADAANEQEKEVIHQLESLFACDLPFIEFYSAYKRLISGLNLAPKRPTNYYLSWRRTKDILDFTNHSIQDVFSDLVQQNGITPEDLNCNLNNLYSCLEENVFSRFPQLMADCFVELGRRNLVAIDAVPHVIRNDEAIQELFVQFGMKAYLPNAELDYNLYEEGEPRYEELDDIRYLRQFFNLYAFYADCNLLKGIDILSLSKAELKNLLDEDYCYFGRIVNFRDSNDNYLLPMMYVSHHVFSPRNRFLILEPFAHQAYHIVTRKGKVIDDTGYYDFYLISQNSAYLQYAKTLKWVRWFFDEETHDIVKQDVFIDDPYEEGVWVKEEERFQKSIIENHLANQLDTFEIIELEFGKQDEKHSLYLTMLNNPTEEGVRNEMISSLSRLLNSGIDISDTYVAAFELYKELLHSNGSIEFSPPSLNYFILNDGLTDKLVTGYRKHYQNDDFSKELNNELLRDRPIRSHFSLGLFQYRGHYTISYQFYFQMNESPEVFQQDCEDFMNRNTFAMEGDLEAYSNDFLNYLLGKNYKEVKAYRQYLGKNSIQGLLGIELNQERRLNNPFRPANNTNMIDEDDDLPF
jgi:hypothetical protein